MKKFYITILNILLFSVMGFSQGDEFVPNGKPILRIFSNFHTILSDGESNNGFQLTRVYLGYEHNFSKNLSAKAVLDVGDPGLESYQRLAYIKNASLNYHVNNLTVKFGLIATTHFKIQEAAWGYRYLLKSSQDLYRFNSSADLGLSVAYKVNEIISADFIIANGEGYTKLQSDSVLRTGFGVTLTPVTGVTGRVYYDFSSKDVTQSSIAAFIGYTHKKFSLGGEYMKQFNPLFLEGQAMNGWSFYGTLFASKRIRIFGRFDQLSSNPVTGDYNLWNIDDNGQLYIAGFEYSPLNGVKLSPNFRGWNPADETSSFITTIILNCEVIF